MNKKKDKDKLTPVQYQILRKQDKDKRTTEHWIRNTGLNVCVFNKLPVQVLRAQQVAHTLLTQNLNLLTTEQIKTLRTFQRKVGNTKTQSKLKPASAYPILNINTRINRKLFEQHRKLGRQSGT